MKATFELHAKPRADIGKGASRRLRHAGSLPAIIYGAGQEPEAITFEHKDVFKATENEAFFSHILTIHVDGKKHSAIVKDMQRHPYKKMIMHMDLLRVKLDEAITMNVPLHFVGGEDAPGVKEQGGSVAQLENSVEISCLPTALPEYIEIDLSSLELNQTLHLSDIKVPEGVSLTALTAEEPNDLAIANVAVIKEVAEEEPAEADAEGEAAAEGDAAPEGGDKPAEGEDKSE